MHSSGFQIQVYERESEKWEVAAENAPIRAFGLTRRDAYFQFLAVYELYQQYGERWMTAVIAERSEKFVDAHAEMCGNPWNPDVSR